MNVDELARLGAEDLRRRARARFSDWRLAPLGEVLTDPELLLSTIATMILAELDDRTRPADKPVRRF